MTLKLGDFVGFDYAIAELKKEENGGNFHGSSLGSVMSPNLRYDRRYFNYCSSWYICSDAKKVTPDDLKDIRSAIEDNHHVLKQIVVKEFIERLSKWCLVNLT